MTNVDFNLNLKKDELLDCIRNGIADAFMAVLEAGDGYNGEIIREPFLKAIEEGTYRAVKDCMMEDSDD